LGAVFSLAWASVRVTREPQRMPPLRPERAGAGSGWGRVLLRKRVCPDCGLVLILTASAARSRLDLAPRPPSW